MKNFLRDGLKKLIERDDRRPLGARAATIIALASRKGGVGKTTSAVQLASALARFHHRRVLLIDLDPQGHVSAALASALRSPPEPSLSRVLLQESGAEVLDAAAQTAIPDLHVTVADPALVDTENLLNSRIGKEFALRDALRVTRTHYDVILLDCPPNLGNLTVNALAAADLLIAPCDATPLGVRGVVALLESCAAIADRLNPSLDLLGVLVTRLDARSSSLNQALIADLEDAVGDRVLPVRIPASAAVTRAQRAGTDLFEHEPDGRVATAYRELSDHLVAALARRAAGT